MKKTLSRLMALAAVGVLFAGSVTTASAQQSSSRKCAKPAGLAGSITWGNPDPLYLQRTATTSWQNCKGVLRSVVTEMRILDANGGLVAKNATTYTPDVVHKPNGIETKSLSCFMGNDGYGESIPCGASPDSLGGDGWMAMKTCSVWTDGKSHGGGQPITLSYYLMIRGYDRKGNKILELATPLVACGQNG